MPSPSAAAASKPAMALDWLRTLIVVVTVCGSVFLAYGKLDARAESAGKDAAAARAKAEEVEKIARDTRDEFLKTVAGLASDVRNVKTILDERLPRAEPGVEPKK